MEKLLPAHRLGAEETGHLEGGPVIVVKTASHSLFAIVIVISFYNDIGK